VSTISRTVDDFLIAQVRTQSSQNSELSAYYDLASRIDNLLSDSDAGISPTLQQFFNATQGVADAPGSIPARQVMLSSAESVVERMHYIYQNMNSLNDAIKIDVSSTVKDINQLASSVADLNSQIAAQSQKFGQPPNDLLDQRDVLLRQLSERVEIKTVAQNDGTLSVFIGTGQSLVVGNRTWSLNMVSSRYSPEDFDLELGTGSGAGVNVTQQITGGSLGGILNFKKEIIDPALNQLGRVAVGLAATFNAQNAQGLSLNDVLGTEFFNDFTVPGAVEVLERNTNAGSGVVSVDIVDASKLAASDYILRYDGSDNYSLLRLPDNTVATTFNSAIPVTTQFEGIQIHVTAVPNNGDSFLIRPTRTAAKDIALQIDNVMDIAAAGAVRGFADTNNVGKASITAGELITDTADPAYVAPAAFNTAPSVTIAFRTSGAGTAPYADEYTLDGGGSWQAYTDGADIKLDGKKVQISGTPFDGDVFTMERNTGAESDNRNALELAALQSKDTLGDSGSGATMDFQTAYGRLVSMIGSRTHQADIAGSAQEVALQQAVAARDRVSGVNLDEEAANLIRMQQSYQAVSKVITTAQSLFQTLLDAVR
jgi:flagellar hook-associated protein 1 FlgK